MSPTAMNEGEFAAPPNGLPPEEILFGRSPAMRRLQQTVQKIVEIRVPVLLEGEGGTGKELLARWIHNNSPWKAGPFVKVNCAAIPSNLLESELFGFEKGAFTGAVQRKPGRVEAAEGGTLFLDEIAEIDRGLQAKLLQFLQDGRFARIGGLEEHQAATRVICASSANLEEGITAGRFRSDLFYRINVVRMRLPKLVERREDVPMLAEYLRGHFVRQFGLHREPISADVMAFLEGRAWPGNIRELSNCIARYVLMGIDGVGLPASPRAAPQPAGALMVPRVAGSLKHIARTAVFEMERKLILEALEANRWNRRRAAQSLKISYRALIYKIRAAGLNARRQPSMDGPSGENGLKE